MSDNNRRFTGETQDPTGLYYLRARYYDPTTGRFLTRDPFPGLITNPQTLNPYVYVGNNPVNLLDPSGEFVPLGVILGGAVIGGLASGAGYVLGAKITGQEINSQELGIAILTGMVAGGLTPVAAALMGPVAGGALVGGGANAAQYYFVTEVTGQCRTRGGWIANIAAGSLMGGASGLASSSFDDALLGVTRPWVAPPARSEVERVAMQGLFSRGDLWEVVMFAAKKELIIAGVREFGRSASVETATNVVADYFDN